MEPPDYFENNEKLSQSNLNNVIMIVEDNEQLLYLTKEILEINNYHVEAFQTFQIALDYFKNNYSTISALLLDMQLRSKQDYLTTIPSFLAISENVPIIGMSGEINPNHLPENLRKKLRHFFCKPFEIKQLLDLLATITKAENF